MAPYEPGSSTPQILKGGIVVRVRVFSKHVLVERIRRYHVEEVESVITYETVQLMEYFDRTHALSAVFWVVAYVRKSTCFVHLLEYIV